MVNQSISIEIGSVESADLYIFSEIGYVRSARPAYVHRWVSMICRISMIYLSGVSVICMISRPEWGMYDVHDMHIFICGSS